MEEKILLDIEFNNSEVQSSIKTISEARKEIDALTEANKELAKQGQKNSTEYVKNQESIRALSAVVNENSKVVQASTQANKANAESIEKVKAENTLLLAERKKLDASTAEGKTRIDEINATLDKNNSFLDSNISKTEKQRKGLGAYSGMLGTISPQVGAFAGNLGAAEEGSGGLTKGIFSMVKASLAFIATPLGATIALLVVGFKTLMTFLTGSTAGMDLLEDATSALSTILDVVTDRVVKFVGGIGKLLTGDFSGALDDITGSFKGIGDEIEREIALTLELNKAIRELEDAEINYDIQASKTANTIKLLLLQSKNRTLSERERIKLLDQAAKLEEDQNAQLIKNKKEALRLANEEANKRVEIARIAGETEEDFGQRLIDTGLLLDDQRDKVKDSIIAYNNALGEGISVLEKIQNQQDALAEKEEAERQKRAEAEKKRLDDIAKKQEELRKREESAANELEILKLQKQAREIQGLENQTDKLIEIEQEKAEQLLANTELTESERQKIIFESDEAINEILSQSREREELERQASLERSLADFQEYTQGLINAEKERLLQGLITKEEYDQSLRDLDVATLETQALIKEQFGERDLALDGRITDGKIANAKYEADIKEQEEQRKVEAVKAGLGTIASAFNKQSIAFKVLASTQTLITTYQSAIAAFNSLANIPYVGTILGIAAAAAATANGLAAVAKINSTQPPKMEEGGAMEIQGPRHTAGGVDVKIGGRRVANVEGGEKMVILKRGANLGMLRGLSTINAMAGGRDFFTDRTPRFHNQDGGFIARAASSQRQILNDSLSANLQSRPIFVRVSDLDRVEGQIDFAEVVGDLQ